MKAQRVPGCVHVSSCCDACRYGTNYIVGGVTFSQLRVKARDCRDSLGGMKLQSASTEITCREDGTSGDAFEEDLEDKATFGDNGVQFTWEGTYVLAGDVICIW